MDCCGSGRRCGLRQGSTYKIHFQYLHLGDIKQDQIEVPLSVSKKVMGTSLERKRGWVTWYSCGTEMLSSTALSQWEAESRAEWLLDVSKGSPRSQQSPCAGPLSGSSSSEGPNILLFFILLHGMSPPGADFDVIENWSNIIHAVLQMLPSVADADLANLMRKMQHQSDSYDSLWSGILHHAETEGRRRTDDFDQGTGRHEPVKDGTKPKLHTCFWAPTYRKQTWMSIEACLEVIIPALVRELQEYVVAFDDIYLYSVGHSLGGLLSRFVFDRRLLDILPTSRPKDVFCQTELEDDVFSKFAALIADDKIHLETLCTLASPHAGSLGTKSVMRIFPETVSKLRFFAASQMARQICNSDEAGLLRKLSLHEAAGQSWIWSRNSSSTCMARMSDGTSSPKETVQKNSSEESPTDGKEAWEAKEPGSSQERVFACDNIPGALGLGSSDEHKSWGKAFRQIVLYGVLNTDWLVGANSALATQYDISKTRAAEIALSQEMTPVCLDLDAEPINEFLPDLVAEEIDLPTRRAGEELRILEGMPKVKRYLVHIPQNPIMTRPHSTLKGAPSLVTPEREKSMRFVASRILQHVATSILS